MGLGADLPAQVYWQWRRWCISDTFYEDDPALPPLAAPYTGPMKLVAMEDDVMMPPKSVWKLARFYPEAQQSRQLLRPQDYGLKRIGHIEVLNPRNKALWPDLLA